MVSRRSMSLRRWIIRLAVFDLALSGIADLAWPQADVVYSARYYKPGRERSYYKIWRTGSDGSGLVQVTSGDSDDHSPVWLADGKTILFVRETRSALTLCTVGEDGGPATEPTAVPDGYVYTESVAPDRRSVVFHVRDRESKLVHFDIVTRRHRDLGTGGATAWSPDSQWLYVSEWGGPEPSAHIRNLVTGRHLPLADSLGAATWLDDSTLVAEKTWSGDTERAMLVVMHADGTTKREVLLPSTWDDEAASSDFADNLFAIPGDSDSIIYGLHAGNSTAGSAQLFYRVSLKGEETTLIVHGRDLAWSADGQSFVTGEGRYIERHDSGRDVWVSRLFVVSLADGESRPLVDDMVSVGGFDWKPRSR